MLRLTSILLLITAYATSAQTDCAPAYFIPAGSGCISGGSINLIEFTPRRDMTVTQILVGGSTAEATISDIAGEIAASEDGRFPFNVTMRAGVKYFITLKTTGCPDRAAEPSMETREGLWHVEYSDCREPPCEVAAKLLRPGCEEAPLHSDSHIPLILQFFTVTALVAAAYYLGRVHGKNEAIELIVKFKEVGDKKR